MSVHHQSIIHSISQFLSTISPTCKINFGLLTKHSSAWRCDTLTKQWQAIILLISLSANSGSVDDQKSSTEENEGRGVNITGRSRYI